MKDDCQDVPSGCSVIEQSLCGSISAPVSRCHRCESVMAAHLVVMQHFATLLRRRGKVSHFLAHQTVSHVREIDWEELRLMGVRGAVIDKDNTLNEPGCENVDCNDVVDAVSMAVKTFGPGRVAVFSNTVGYNCDSAVFEAALGGNVPVIQHNDRKPGGGGDVASYFADFNISMNSLVAVGDRRCTDVIFGNSHGMYVVKTDRLTEKEDSLGSKVLRVVEDAYATYIISRGGMPPVWKVADVPTEKDF